MSPSGTGGGCPQALSPVAILVSIEHMSESASDSEVGEAARLRAAGALLLSLADGAESGVVAPGSAADDAIALLGVIEQVELTLCERVERVDRLGEFAEAGATSTTAWVRASANCSGGLASRRVRIGRALADRLPCSRAAWAAGTATTEHVDVIARVVRGLDDDQAAVLDRELSAAAAFASPIELSRLADRYRFEADPDAAEAKARKAKRDQKLHHSQTFGGGWVLSATFDAETGAVVNAAIDAFTPIPGAPAEGELPESAGYRRAQALAEICRQALEHGEGRGAGGEKPQLTVIVDDEVLRTGIGYGMLSDGTPIPSRAVRRLACDAKIIPALYGTKSCPLDIGRSARVVTPAMRKALVLRDKGCRFPGCDRPASWTDAHHVIHWRDLGPTALWNLMLICRAHHHKVHDDGWHIDIVGDGEFRFRPPDPRPGDESPHPWPPRGRYARAA